MVRPCLWHGTTVHLRRGLASTARPLPPRKCISFIGAPFCEGQNLVGADLGPTAVRAAGLQQAAALLGWDWCDEGDLDFVRHFKEHGFHSEKTSSVETYREWLDDGMRENFSTWVQRRAEGEAADTSQPPAQPPDTHDIHADSDGDSVVNVELMGSGLNLVHSAVLEAAKSGNFALTVGGDHSIAAGSINALHHAYPDLGVIWIDAHADANTPKTSPSRHYHGMPAAHLLGWFEKALPGFEWFTPGCLSESRLAYIGLRDVDEGEAALLRESNVHVYTMREVDKHGISKVIEMALSAIDPNNRRPLHLSLDVDGVDPHFAPGTGTCARGGLTYREIHYVCEELALTNRLVSMDLVEVNPVLDPVPEGNPMHGDNPLIARSSPTVQLAVELALSALGKRIM